MKKHIGIVLVGSGLVVVLLLYTISFSVRWQEKALVLSFGKIVRQETSPGLKWKWPWPMQSLVKFDGRYRTYKKKLTETITTDEQTIVASVYVNWRIDDAEAFYKKFRKTGIERAEDIVVEAEENAIKAWVAETTNIISEYNFGEIVTLDKDNCKLAKLEKEMLALVIASEASQDYGIEFVDLGISRLGVPESVTESVFNRIRADRQAVVKTLESEGKSESASMRGAAESEAEIIKAKASAQARRIEGEGDAKAAEYYAQFLAHPELANFLRKLETLKTLNDRTTLVLGSESSVYEMLHTGPKVNEDAGADKPTKDK